MPQVIFVFAAFFVMALIGSIFGGRIIDRNVESYGKEVVNTASEQINAYLDEYRMMLDDVAFSLLLLVNEGADVQTMQEHIQARTVRLQTSSRIYEDFSGFYGVVSGEFIDGSGWDPMNPESEDYNPDYVPQNRPWYIGAMQALGQVHFTDPYIDADTGEYVLTASKLLLKNDRTYFGVIAMDFYLDDVEEIVNSLSLMESGYGILLDSERIIVVTEDPSRIGMFFDDIDEAHAEIGRNLELFRGAVHNRVKSDGEEYVVFFKQIPCNWYVGIASLRDNYYSDSRQMTLVLAIAGLLLSIPLCAVLVVLHIRKARADEASNLKTSFLANMSHEIRTPMNAIIGMTELLQNEPLGDPQDSYVKDINTSAQALLAIINDILDLSKIEAGKIELHPIDYDFPSFLENIVSMFTFVTDSKGLDFRYEKTGDIPQCLYGDDIRLRQVLTNLCGNAVKFTNKGYISLFVTVYEDKVHFVVKDTGLGIRKEDMPKLFNPFEQFDMQSNRKIIGTGLGLPISKNFVEMMGGTMKVESKYGEGTMFLVSIPKVLGNAENIGSNKTPDALKSFIAPEARVLVVDDNEVNLKVASGLLRSLYKINAQTAQSGKDAVELVVNNEYDIVFMDHMMPEMDGVQTVQEIRRQGSRNNDVKYIALTANAVMGVKEMFIANGFDGFISKPIDTADLHSVLIDALPPETIVTTAGATEAAVSDGSSSEILKNAIANAKQSISASFSASLGKVPAINAEIALSRVSGLEDMLKETVELFYDKLPVEISRLEEYSGSGDMQNFAISVHGLKSALSAVGAMELSETAFELEKASKNGDSSYCSDRLPDFAKDLRALETDLGTLFPEKSAASGAAEAGDPELLKENVRKAAEACDDFDDAAALEAIEPLLKLDYGEEINTLLKSAAAAIKDFDYDKASDTLREALK